MKDFNAPFYVNYQRRVDECREEFPELKQYLTDRMPEVEVRNPNEMDGIYGMVWREQLEAVWKNVAGGSFWGNIYYKDFSSADAQLRANRPDLYELLDIRYHFASSILQELDADTAEAILEGATSIDQVIDRLNALAR
jgi:hypothetical protein